MSVRINGLDTHYCYRDIVDVVEQAAGGIVVICNPCVGVDLRLEAACQLLAQFHAPLVEGINVPD